MILYLFCKKHSYPNKTQNKQSKDSSTFATNDHQATSVSISDEAQVNYKIINDLKFFEINSKEANPLQESYQKINKEEAIEQVKLMAEARAKERAERHPFDDDLITYKLPEGYFAHNIASALEGKLDNPSVYAVQLEKALRGSNGSAEDIEAKAIQREIALQHAQYVADNYFDNEEDAQTFLSEVKTRAEDASLYERGYYRHEGEVYKNYTRPMDNGRVSFGELAKRYMDEEYYERFINEEGTSKEATAFLLDIQKNYAKYQKQVEAEFNANEKLVTELQNNAKELANKIDWNSDNFIHVMESALEDLGHADLAKWHLDMLNLFN